MTPIEAYVAPAAQRRGWWRFVAGTLVIICFWVVLTLVVLGAYGAWQIAQTGEIELGLAEMSKLVDGGTPGRIMVMILTFGGVWVGVFAAMAFFHGQAFPTIFAPDRQSRPGGFVPGVLLALVFVTGPVAGGLLFTTPVRTDLSLDYWALLLIPLIPLIFVQATGEELIFRGYMLQQLRSRAQSPLVWAFLPALAFGCLHIGNAGTLEGTIFYIAITLVMGLIFATLVWRTGSLWTAAGFHTGNNVVGLLVIGPEGPLSGTQLWLVPKEDMATLFPVNLGMGVILLIVLLSPVGRIFGDGNRQVETGEAD